jgi:branched-chain amino acid aminotransferase
LYFTIPPHFSSKSLQDEILLLTRQNKASAAGRIRITVFKGEGGIWEPPTTAFNYIVQCWPLDKPEFTMNDNGLDIGVFEAVRKSCDAFSNLKSNNYQIYALAAQFAKLQRWNEAVVINHHGRIADTTIANLFFIKNDVVFTPALAEGGVEGVMRTYLMEQFKTSGITSSEGAFEPAELETADEIFCTNAFYGIRWVKRWGNKLYGTQKAPLFFNRFVKPLFD